MAVGASTRAGALGAALMAAGFVPVTFAPTPGLQHRLREMLRAALRDHPRDHVAAHRAFLAALVAEPAVELEMLRAERARIARDALRQEAEAMRREAQPSRPGAGRFRCDDRNASARPLNPAAGIAAVNAVARRTLLDTFIVNGRPIGDVTAAEASAWAARRDRDARFVRALTANLPPNDPIRRWRTPEEAEAMHVAAMKDTSDDA